MATTSKFNYNQILNEVNQLLWGSHVKYEIFKRWSQGKCHCNTFLLAMFLIVVVCVGFFFSSHERSALEQFEGGPCAVLAPVQAFIIKNMLLELKDENFIHNVSNINDHLFNIISTTK